MKQILADAQIQAVAGILWKNGDFLAVERPEGKVMAGYWEFPGGKMERGESPLNALCRELLEELNVTVITAFFWRTVSHRYAHGHVTLHVFHVPCFTNEPTPMEGQQIRWLTPGKEITCAFLPADLPLVRDLSQSGQPCSG